MQRNEAGLAEFGPRIVSTPFRQSTSWRSSCSASWQRRPVTAYKPKRVVKVCGRRPVFDGNFAAALSRRLISSSR